MTGKKETKEAEECYTAVVLQDIGPTERPYGVGKVVKGRTGYEQINVPAFKTYAQAEQIAKDLNAQKGLSDRQVALLVLGSMRGSQ
jgi:hypothetical protein